MQWGGEPGAGFSRRASRGCRSATSRSTSRRSATTRARCSSLHRELLALRREFVGEPYETLAAGDAVLAYRRGPFVIALNLSGEEAERPAGRVRLSTELDGGGERLRPNEGVVLSP